MCVNMVIKQGVFINKICETKSYIGRGFYFTPNS